MLRMLQGGQVDEADFCRWSAVRQVEDLEVIGWWACEGIPRAPAAVIADLCTETCKGYGVISVGCISPPPALPRPPTSPPLSPSGPPPPSTPPAWPPMWPPLPMYPEGYRMGLLYHAEITGQAPVVDLGPARPERAAIRGPGLLPVQSTTSAPPQYTNIEVRPAYRTAILRPSPRISRYLPQELEAPSHLRSFADYPAGPCREALRPRGRAPPDCDYSHMYLARLNLEGGDHIVIDPQSIVISASSAHGLALYVSQPRSPAPRSVCPTSPTRT